LPKQDSRLSYFIDGAHTPESMLTAAQWFAHATGASSRASGAFLQGVAGCVHLAQLSKAAGRVLLCARVCYAACSVLCSSFDGVSVQPLLPQLMPVAWVGAPMQLPNLCCSAHPAHARRRPGSAARAGVQLPEGAGPRCAAPHPCQGAGDEWGPHIPGVIWPGCARLQQLN